MALDLGEGFVDLFKRRGSEGIGKEERRADVIVAEDGSGDTDSLREALKLVPNNGKIFIKEGTFVDSLGVTIPSNIVIEGAGFGSILRFEHPTDSGAWIGMNGASNIVIKNLQIYFFNHGMVTPESVIAVDSTNDITFDQVMFKSGDNNFDTYVWTPFGNSANRIKFLNCVVDTTEGAPNISFCSFGDANKNEFIGNRFDTIALLHIGIGNDHDNCVIRGNYLRDLTLENGSDNNVVIGNQTDNAIVNNGAGNQVANNAIF